MTRLIFLVLAFCLLHSCESAPPPDITDPGQLFFLGYAKEQVNCARCHGADGRGGMEAPDIRGVFDKYDAEEIVDFIELGKGEGKDAMPAFETHLSEAEVMQIVAFLRTLQVADSSVTK